MAARVFGGRSVSGDGPVVDWNFRRMDTVVDPAITCSGGTNGTRVDSTGTSVAATSPRLMHSPVRKNFLQKSCDYTAAPWAVGAYGTGTAAVLESNAASTPDGYPATRVTLDAGAGTTLSDQSFIYQYVTGQVTTGGTYTASSRVRGVAGEKILVRAVAGGGYATHTFSGDWEYFARAEVAISDAANIEIGLRQGTGAGTINSTVTFLISESMLEPGGTRGEYIDNPGNTPRHECLGLLVEEARTNKFLYSRNFSAADWSKSNLTVTPAAVLGPDGTLTGQKIEATVTGSSALTQAVTAAGVAETMYFIVRQGNLAVNNFVLRNATTSSNLVDVSFTWATQAFSGPGASSCVARDVAGGWWLLSLAASSGITVGDTLIGYAGAAGGSYTAGDHWFGWAAQSEAGSFPTSYIPTTSAAVTRAADRATALVSAFDFNPSEGTLYVEVENTDPGGSGRALWLSGTDNYIDFMALFHSAGAGGAEGRVAGVAQFGMSYGSAPAGQVNKLALAYAANNFSLVANGGSVATDTSGAVPTVTELRIGWHSDGVYTNGIVRRLMYWRRPLSPRELMEITRP